MALITSLQVAGLLALRARAGAGPWATFPPSSLNTGFLGAGGPPPPSRLLLPTASWGHTGDLTCKRDSIAFKNVSRDHMTQAPSPVAWASRSVRLRAPRVRERVWD